MAGEANKRVVFLFADTQIKEEGFVEDISNLLNTYEVRKGQRMGLSSGGLPLVCILWKGLQGRSCSATNKGRMTLFA